MTFLEGGDTCHNNENRPEQRFHFWKPRLCRHGKTSCMVAGIGLCWSDKLNFNNSLRQGYKPLHGTYNDIQICICVVLWSESWLMRGTQRWRRIRIENNLKIGLANYTTPAGSRRGVFCELNHWMISPRRELDPIIAFPVRTEAFRVLYLIALPLSQTAGHWDL